MKNDCQNLMQSKAKASQISGNTAPAGSVAEVRDMLEWNDKGKVKNTIGNCLAIFQNDPVLHDAIRYNLLTERVDVVKPL